MVSDGEKAENMSKIWLSGTTHVDSSAFENCSDIIETVLQIQYCQSHTALDLV